MTERAILFSGAMVQAILAGRKTQTRRIVKPAPDWEMPEPLSSTTSEGWQGPLDYSLWSECADPEMEVRRCPYGGPGDRLWVRETWGDVNLEGAPGIAYRADGHVRDLMDEEDFLEEDGSFDYSDARLKFGKHGLQFVIWSADLLSGAETGWRTSIHMPRWASRLDLRVTSVRVERLNDCTAADAEAEGIREPSLGEMVETALGGVPRYRCGAVTAYMALWNSINGAGSWDANPWVWVVTFERLKV